MKILLLGQHYAPEEISGSVLGIELTTGWIKKGHQITFVTCAPNYPAGRVYPGYRNRLVVRQVMDNVKVIRTWSYISPRKSTLRRVLNQGTFSATALIGALVAGKPDVLLSFSPPLPLGITAWVLSRLWRVPWILYVGDMYPEIAIAAGVLRNRAAIAFFLALERFLYNKATHIEVISEGFRKNLVGKGVPVEKLSVNPVWADPDAVRPMPKENDFRQVHGLSGKFVVMHAGNFGVNNSLEDVIGAADLLKSENDIRFVMIGEGEKKEDICEQAAHRGLKNVLFLPYQPRSAYETVLAAADIGLVSLNPDAHYTSFPSKTFNIMASGRPILAVTPLNNEVADLVRNSQCGVALPPGNPAALAKAILDLKANGALMASMGRNGRVKLENEFSRQRIIELWEKNLMDVVTRQRQSPKQARYHMDKANPISSFFQHGLQGWKKITTFLPIYGFWGSLRLIIKNVLWVERMYRLEKYLSTTEEIVKPKIPLEIVVYSEGMDPSAMKGWQEVLKIRGEYAHLQFRQRLENRCLCFAAYFGDELASFLWIQLPPITEAGYDLPDGCAYEVDGWTFDAYRGKGVHPFLQQAIMNYVRTNRGDIHCIVEHIGPWNKPSVRANLRAGYVITRLELSFIVFGYNRKIILRRMADRAN